MVAASLKTEALPQTNAGLWLPLSIVLSACTFDPSAKLSVDDDASTSNVDADTTAPDADPSAPDADLTIADATPGSPDALPPDAATCPTGYLESPNGSCYRIVPTAASWTDAEADCEDDATGAHLVVIDDIAEDTAILSFNWIGYTERVMDGKFLWVNGSDGAYPGFASGEPVAGGGLCVVTRPDGWHDDGCDELKTYVCEYDKLPALPATY